MTTARYALPEIDVNQASKDTTHNAALWRLDMAVNASVIDADLTAPPGSPGDGDCYLVATGATGDWASHDDDIAFYLSSAWEFISPTNGMIVRVEDDSSSIFWSGTAWVVFPALDAMSAAVYDPQNINEDCFDRANHSGSQSATTITLPVVGSPTLTSVQDMHRTYHSTGVATGGGISDDGDGTITVAAGTGYVRISDADTADLRAVDWGAESGANVSLTDNALGSIYVDYNSGSPRVVATSSDYDDNQTYIHLGRVYRAGTKLHIDTMGKAIVADHARRMHMMISESFGYVRTSGLSVAGTGTRNFSISAGTIWNGLQKASTTSFDSSGSGRFTYYYRNGGAWTSVATQSQINNTQYDNNTGSLSTLTNNRYGVHWVYTAADGDVDVVYGQGDYTLAQADAAQPPSSVPPEVSATAMLIAKITILKSAGAFTSITSPFDYHFTPTGVSNHNDLSSLQGGTSDEFYHLTSAQYAGNLTFTTKTDTGDAAGTAEGAVVINTADNLVRIYADGGWRTMASW